MYVRVLSLLLCLVAQRASAGVAQWDFNGNLASSAGGAVLISGFAVPATQAGVSFSTVTINGQTASVAAFTRGTFFRATHGLGANAGGIYLNDYTLVMDVMFPARPSGWAVLYQTSPNNANDGDWFINPNRGVGISGNYGGLVPDGIWHRLALVVDSAQGTFTSYINGAQVQQNSGITVDGRWSLDSVMLLFADEDQENAGGLVNSVQLRSGALSASEVAALGGPTASGIPLPVTPTLRLTTPNGGETFQAGTTQQVTWATTNPSGLLSIDLMRGSTLARSLGQVQMDQSNFLWTIHPRIGDDTNYAIRISSLSYPTVVDTSDSLFQIVGSGPPINPVFGQPLEQNGGFELMLTNWQTVAGYPTVLTGSAGKGAPYAGARFFHGGSSLPGDAVVRQDIDLLAAGFTAEDLDRGAALDAQARLRNWFAAGTFDDQVFYRVAYLDANESELSSARCMVAGHNVWLARPLTGLLPPGTRKLRVEIVGKHRRDAHNDSMADELIVRLQEAFAPPSPEITKLPMLQDVRQHAMTLLWETHANLALHAVEWGRSNVAENMLTVVETLQIDGTHFVQRATIPNLEPETRYVYRVRSGDSVSPTFTFRTAPHRETPFAVAWWGDNHNGTVTLKQHIANLTAHGPDLIAVAGDMVNSGNSLTEWHNYWFKPLEHLQLAQTTPVIFARGNHDGEHALAYAYSVLPGNESWFAFDYGNSRFIFLDSETPSGASPEQFAWLQAELSRPETQNAAFRIVCFHRPPYANLWNGGGYTGEPFVRADWVPLFEQKRVDIVISGHAHNYNRGASNGVTYIVSGGGGGFLDTERVANWPLYTVEYSRYHYGLMEVNGPVLSWQTFDDQNQLLDLFTLTSRVPQLRIASASSTAVQLTLTGKPGSSYALELSANMQSWQPIITNVAPLSGAPLTNFVSATSGQQFFRARALP